MVDLFQAKFNNGWLGALIFWISSAIIGIAMCIVILLYSSAKSKKQKLTEENLENNLQEKIEA